MGLYSVGNKVYRRSWSHDAHMNWNHWGACKVKKNNSSESLMSIHTYMVHKETSHSLRSTLFVQLIDLCPSRPVYLATCTSTISTLDLNACVNTFFVTGVLACM